MDSLLLRLRRRAENAPDSVFVRRRDGESERIATIGEFHGWVENGAGALLRAGLRPGECVPVIADNDAPAMAAFLAVMRAGGLPAFFPYPNTKQDAQVFHRTHVPVFQRLNVRLAVSDFAVPAMTAIRVMPTAELTAHAPGAVLPALPGPDDPALLQHSSGTTGVKKAVQLTHGAILGQIESYARAVGFAPGDVVASWLPLYHDMGLITGFLMPLAAGGGTACLNPFAWSARPWRLLDLISQTQASHCWLPNFAFNHLVRTAPADGAWNLSSLKALVNCSEPAKPDSMQAFVRRFARHGLRAKQIRVCYALAENVFAATQSDPAPGFVEPMPGMRVMDCGRPIDGVQLRIDAPDAHGIGEIVLASPYLFDGYRDMPEKTAQVLHNNWHRTGDCGFLSEDGRLFVTGRIDDRICVYGRNIHAYDVETAINGIDGVIPGRAVAFGVYDSEAGTHCVVVIAETEQPDDPGLRRRIRDQVSAVLGLVPKKVELAARGWLIKTTSGKVSRSENMKRYLEQQNSGGL